MSKEELYQQFERLGAETVKENLARGAYNAQKVAYAKLWIEEKRAAFEAEQNQERQRINLQSRDVAVSAKDAAWASAQANKEAVSEAKKSNLLATIALIVSVLAIAISILGVFLRN